MKKEAILNYINNSLFRVSAPQIIVGVLKPKSGSDCVIYACQLLNDKNNNNKLNEIIRKLINLSQDRLSRHLNRRNMPKAETLSYYEVLDVPPLSEAEINAERGLIALLENVL